MDNKTFLRLFGEIDDKYIQQANEDVDYWLEAQRGISVRPDDTRRPFFRTVIMTAACTAAVMLGVFALLMNLGIVGKIEIIEGPASTGVEISNSSDSQGIELPEFPSETYLYEEAAYAYEDSYSDVLKRYEVGDMFGEHRLLSAKTIYRITDGVQIRQKQEIIVEGRVIFDLSKCHFTTDGTAYLDITVGSLVKLGLPRISKNFDADMLSYYPPNSRPYIFDETMSIGFTELKIVADYEEKTIAVIGQKVSIAYN